MTAKRKSPSSDRAPHTNASHLDEVAAALAAFVDETGVYTKVETFSGSTFLARRSPDELWGQPMLNRLVRIPLLGGGAAVVGLDDINAMTPYRRRGENGSGR